MSGDRRTFSVVQRDYAPILDLAVSGPLTRRAGIVAVTRPDDVCLDLRAARPVAERVILTISPPEGFLPRQLAEDLTGLLVATAIHDERQGGGGLVWELKRAQGESLVCEVRAADASHARASLDRLLKVFE